MNAYKDNLLNVIELPRRQFVIPVYQRKYKWTSEQCLRLIDDIVKCGRKGIEHFTGTIVYEEKGGTAKKAFLVDGQQRITTVMLLLKALMLIAKESIDDLDAKYVFDSISTYIYADNHDHQKGLKIVPSKNDRNTFNLIMMCESFEELEKNSLISKEKDDLLFNNFKTAYYRFKTEIGNGTNMPHAHWQPLRDCRHGKPCG